MIRTFWMVLATTFLFATSALSDPESDIRAAIATLVKSASTPKEVSSALQRIRAQNGYSRPDVRAAIMSSVPYHYESFLDDSIASTVILEDIGTHPRRSELVEFIYKSVISTFEDGHKVEGLLILSEAGERSDRFKQILLSSLDPHTNGSGTVRTAMSHLKPFFSDPKVRVAIVRTVQERAKLLQGVDPTKRDRLGMVFGETDISVFFAECVGIEARFDEYAASDGFLHPKSFKLVAEWILGRRLKSSEVMALSSVEKGYNLGSPGGFSKGDRRLLMDSGLFLTVQDGLCTAPEMARRVVRFLRGG